MQHIGVSDCIRPLDRRKIIALLGAVALGSPTEVRSQEAGRSYRIGVLNTSPRDTAQFAAMFEGLQRLDFVERQNLTIDPRGFGLRTEQFSEAAIELVNSPVDVIQAGGAPAIRAAQRATTTIPILGNVNDMVAEGLVRSMAHPGGNMTTAVSFSAASSTARQEPLIELIPGARHIAALADPNAETSKHFQALQDSARAWHRPRTSHGSHV